MAKRPSKISPYRFHWAMCTHMPPKRHGSAGHRDPEDSEVIQWIRENAGTTQEAAQAIFRSAYKAGAIWYDGRIAKYVGSWENLLEANQDKFKRAVPADDEKPKKSKKKDVTVTDTPALTPEQIARATVLPSPPTGIHKFTVQDCYEPVGQNCLRLKLLIDGRFNIVLNVGEDLMGDFLDATGNLPTSGQTVMIAAADVIGWRGRINVKAAGSTFVSRM